MQPALLVLRLAFHPADEERKRFPKSVRDRFGVGVHSKHPSPQITQAKKPMPWNVHFSHQMSAYLSTGLEASGGGTGVLVAGVAEGQSSKLTARWG